MAQDGLWECAFCAVECSPAEVAWGMRGEVAVKQHLGGAAVGRRLECQSHEQGVKAYLEADPAAEPPVVLKADPAALRALIGTSAEDWRRRRGASGPQADAAGGWRGRPHLASIYWSDREKSPRIALLLPLNGACLVDDS